MKDFRESIVTTTTAGEGIDLRSLRLARGMTGVEVAGRMRVSPQAYAGFEKNCQAGKLRVGHALKILRILNCAIEVRGPKTYATASMVPAPELPEWAMPEHYTTLPYDCDTDETLDTQMWASGLSVRLCAKDVFKNVSDGLEWAFRTPPSDAAQFTVAYAYKLHQRMFGDVFSGAGTVKPKWQFPGGAYCLTTSRLRNALAAAAAGLASDKPPEDVANELHLKLAADAAFAQGSAAHARAMADLVLVRSGIERFTWGLRLGLDAAERTERYKSFFLCKHRMPSLAKAALAFART